MSFMYGKKHRRSSGGTFLTISTSPAMLSSPSLSRSIAVWKVNFQKVLGRW